MCQASAAVPELEKCLTTVSEKTAGLEQFIAKVKQITRPIELTPELVHEFIEKIVVFEARYLDNRRVQVVDIYYKGLGMIRGFSPEELEEIFQEGEENYSESENPTRQEKKFELFTRWNFMFLPVGGIPPGPYD